MKKRSSPAQQILVHIDQGIAGEFRDLCIRLAPEQHVKKPLVSKNMELAMIDYIEKHRDDNKEGC